MRKQILSEDQAKIIAKADLHVMSLRDTKYKMNCVQNGKEIKEELKHVSKKCML